MQTCQVFAQTVTYFNIYLNPSNSNDIQNYSDFSDQIKNAKIQQS